MCLPSRDRGLELSTAQPCNLCDHGQKGFHGFDDEKTMINDHVLYILRTANTKGRAADQTEITEKHGMRTNS